MLTKGKQIHILNEYENHYHGRHSQVKNERKGVYVHVSSSTQTFYPDDGGSTAAAVIYRGLQ
ncbi:hypothetical protein GCM10008014_46270 [Paenibacillus silvae]|uniref:Uncharacterized protein n=1 Tax=Paenibacillus silvae TaxID=1325358 RepID=A0ABQ1ZJ35_9BACL|nr:hypothetical protein GCM10008014_46270 [Paenibacillus silvae]